MEAGAPPIAETKNTGAQSAPAQGGPTDLLGAFGSALVKAARAPAAVGGDPHVSVAFVLGWNVAELWSPERRRAGGSAADALGGLGTISAADWIGVVANEVKAGVFKLGEVVKAAGLDPVPVDLEKLTGEGTRVAAVKALNAILLQTLTAADFRLGKAYSLGRALADLTRRPVEESGVSRELDKEDVIATILVWLDDLSTALPPHAAHSVATSIQHWVKPVVRRPSVAEAIRLRRKPAAPAEPAPADERVRQFRRQGELWRALLSGEKQGTEMLEIDNYLAAARDVARRMSSVLVRVLVQFWPVTVAVVALVVLAVALLSQGDGKAPDVLAGAGSILAALGLTWKGLGGALGGLAGKLEQPLWGAVLDDAITNAITLSPDTPDDHRGRRLVARRLPAPGVVTPAATSEPGPVDGHD